MGIGTSAPLARLGNGEGEHFDIAGAHLVWKARRAATGGSFCMFEQRLSPGEGVPAHRHGYTEVFYVLAGTLTFQDENGARCACTPGDTVIVHPERLHAFFNEGSDEVRLLSIAPAAHQTFFDAVAEEDRHTPFATLSSMEAMTKVAAIGAGTDTRFEPMRGAASS